MKNTQRYALCIEYNGAAYSGWQRQKAVASVQQHVEEAIAKIALEPIPITCAGRTDAGVHGTYQIVHFDTAVKRPMKAWIRGVNTHLPADIAVKWGQAVSDDFHARFSATARRYRYIIYNSPLRAAILNAGLTHFYYPLNAELMHQAAQCLVGEHDFSSFRAANCQSHSPVRTLLAISVTRIGEYIVIDVKANAFLHHMVRNITGTLMKVGMQEQPVSWVGELLALKDRKAAGMTAKPNGLYLIDVDYPSQFNLPKSQLGPLFLPS